MPSGGRGEQSGVTPPGWWDIIQQENCVVWGGLGWPQPGWHPGVLLALAQALLGDPLSDCLRAVPQFPSLYPKADLSYQQCG